MNPLKLVALDDDDIAIVSAHLQDAILKVGDIRWRPEERRLVVGLDRFDWEAATADKPAFRRRHSALRFDRVLACQCRHLDSRSKDQMLNLLAVAFAPTDAPGGVVTLTFSGGGTLKLDVECIEVELADLGPTWDAEVCPNHSLDDLGLDDLGDGQRPGVMARQG